MKFTEREFEFCFNFEFVRGYPSALIGTPIIPSQRMEGILGYDVEFRLNNGQYSRSLFLQHKVSYYAEHRSGRNVNIWNCYSGPYYRFSIERLDRSRQHNLLFELANKGEDVFYCAPLFTSIDNLQRYFVQSQVIENSRFFNPFEMGKIHDFEQHHVTCDQTGTYGFFHSDHKKLENIVNWENLRKHSKQRPINLEYIDHLENMLIDSIKIVFAVELSVPEQVKKNGIVPVISYILRKYFNLTWLILP